KKLFTNSCAVCHGIHEQVVGPALVNITDRRPVDWLRDFIHNSQKVIQSGDEYAVNLYNQFNKMMMPNFDYLSDDEVLSILAYVQEASKPVAVTADEGGSTATTGDISTGNAGTDSISSEYLTLIIAGFIFILILILVVLILLT